LPGRVPTHHLANKFSKAIVLEDKEEDEEDSQPALEDDGQEERPEVKITLLKLFTQ
jgi:hypothetical protein